MRFRFLWFILTIATFALSTALLRMRAGWSATASDTAGFLVFSLMLYPLLARDSSVERWIIVAVAAAVIFLGIESGVRYLTP